MPELDAATFDRAAGVLLTAAVADALTAGHTSLPVGPPLMTSGEWTEATALTLSLVDAALAGQDLRTGALADRIAAEWWGVADRALLWAGPLALAYLADPDALVATATELAVVAHLPVQIGEACALWGLAIRHGVLTGELDACVGLGALPGPARDRWAQRLAQAEAGPIEIVPVELEEGGARPGDTVAVAWSTIMGTPVLAYDPERHLTDALAQAARLGHDVAASVIGALLGAVHGSSAVPVEWAEQLHGSGGCRALDLIERARALVAAAPVGDAEDLLRGL